MFSRLLHEKGLHATTARIAVFKVISENNGLTAEDIYIQVNKSVNLKIGTIYRVLSDLEKYFLIKRILFGRQKSIYKVLEQKINCNIRDVQSGKMYAYHNSEIEDLLQELVDKLDGEFSTIDLILYK